MSTNRRHFLGRLAAAVASPALLAGMPAKGKTFPISSNTYNWGTFYGRQGKTWGQDWDACLADYVKSGLQAIEPGFGNADDVRKLAPFLKKYSLQMPSAYVNSSLHRADEAARSIATVLEMATEAKRQLGTQIIVTNPNPLKWGSLTELKTDADLGEQAKNLEKLGAELRGRGLTLAYHTHDVELAAGAREFHHMMLNTTAANVSFCFDAHWVFRGSQNSALAVYDVLKQYGRRVVEIHLRQSAQGTWTETFAAEGDIDYRRVARELKALKITPHLVLEQAVEAQTANTQDGVAAHQKGLAVVKELFGRN
ncbi:MAG: sugar phosphate isomerase/epimerase [Bernardetiaceae bacterium]|jgi:inosose dehydratase|nr:sugar phosphate isomerase/epimerase [Bernardetiaceae bacterium]